MENRTTLNIVIIGCFIIIHLFSSIDKPLLHRRYSFLFLHTLLDSLNCIITFNIYFNLLTGKGFHLNHHTSP
eukprot:Gb_28674 [translate_table: standard]